MPLVADTTPFAPAVHTFDETTPRRTIRLAGFFSSYDAGDNSRVGHGFAPTIKGIPLPASALASAGSEAHTIIWDPRSGVEYGFWKFGRDARGGITAINGYRYHTTPGYFGRFADGKAGRGAGTSYLAGLVRPWELTRGRIDHALAFAYAAPSRRFVYPASRSDGRGDASDLPMGTRLQLDPRLTAVDFAAWKLSSPARTIARALQKYGMYVVGNARPSKIYLEDRRTARWGADVTRNLLQSIPMSAFRVVSASTSLQGGSPGIPATSVGRAADGAGERRAASSILEQIARRLRRVRPSALRARTGIRIRLTSRPNYRLAISIAHHDRGYRALLMAGSGRMAARGATTVSLRPTTTGSRLLRPRRRVILRVRLTRQGSRAATAAKLVILRPGASRTAPARARSMSR